MNYLLNSILKIIKKPHYLLLFIVISLSGLPISILMHSNQPSDFTYLINLILIVCVSSFLVSGIYSLSWNALNGETSEFISESKKYFLPVLGVTVVVGIFESLSVTPITMLHKYLFLPDVPLGDFSKRIDANIVRTTPAFIISTLFIYAIPAVFSLNLTGKQAVAMSWRFLLSNLKESKIIIYLSIINYVANSSMTQYIVNLDDISNQYWIVSTLNSAFSHAIMFVIFLTAAQILSDAAHEKSHITNQ